MRIRHKLRKLWAEGKLVVGGKAPAWLKALPKQSPVEEATPEEVAAYTQQPSSEGVLVSQPLPDPKWCVGINRTNGTLLISGVGCLYSKDWDIRLIASREDCIAYINRHTDPKGGVC